jgi:hypothetical protein
MSQVVFTRGALLLYTQDGCDAPTGSSGMQPLRGGEDAVGLKGGGAPGVDGM